MFRELTRKKQQLTLNECKEILKNEIDNILSRLKEMALDLKA